MSLIPDWVPDFIEEPLENQILGATSRGVGGSDSPAPTPSGQTAEEAFGGGGGSAEEIIAGGPVLQDPADSRGAPLWPFEADPDTLGGLTVENRSRMAGPVPGEVASPGRNRIPARYFEADTLAPMRWSQEQRADLQRLMQQMGLYGDRKVRLGTWTGTDQSVFASVLAESNVAGLTWQEILAKWKTVGLPPDIAQRIQQDRPKQPTIRVSNPLDVQQVARQTSRSLIGREDRDFVQDVVPEFQQAEVRAQQQVITDQDQGGGGTVMDAPSAQAFAQDRLERERPAEVDAYQYLGNYNALLQRLGLAG